MRSYPYSAKSESSVVVVVVVVVVVEVVVEVVVVVVVAVVVVVVVLVDDARRPVGRRRHLVEAHQPRSRVHVPVLAADLHQLEVDPDLGGLLFRGQAVLAEEL